MPPRSSPDGDESSIGLWLRRLKSSDAQAMQVVWERFFGALAAYAERHLGSHPRLKGTGEDVAASVFESLWRGCREGRFADVSNQSELWWTLLKMARRKCVSHTRREYAAKRGGSHREVPLQAGADGRSLYHALVSEDPDPHYLAAVTDELSSALQGLPDALSRRIAALALEGYTVIEITSMVELSESSVRRKLDIACDIWGPSRQG